MTHKDKTILVVDDQPSLVRLVRDNLESRGFRVTSASDGKKALDIVENDKPDLVVLDIMMPGLDGYEVCRRIREFSTVPIIMLTARNDQESLVHGFEAGADDYIPKPFHANELLARIEAVLRRSEYTEVNKYSPSFTCGDISIDFVRHEVTKKDAIKQLTPTEYRLLYYLAINSGKVMLHADLLTKVWGPEYSSATDYLRVYIRHLRTHLEDKDSEPVYIITVPGVGYVLKCPQVG
ncbi:response regulator transcription factor [Candidatus Chlorohelix sp.]|uniref:response regulator transcription factor n=1 Tax=Candidatus Chlorohelix sp. TaxID=3139201 RepID=UPI00302BA154